MKEKKEYRSANSMQAEAWAWASDAPFPICFLVPITSSASWVQTLK
jgi:hypothetical protein